MLVLRRLPDPDIPAELFTSPSLAGDIARAEFFGPLSAEAVAAGSIDLAGAAAAKVLAQGQASGVLGLDGTTTAKAPAQGQAAGAIGLDGTATAKAPAQGQASGTLGLDGAGAAAALVKAQAAGALGLTGTGVITVPSLIDYSTGRLAFAAFTGRRGTILNAAKRTGTILNPTRKGRILEIA